MAYTRVFKNKRTPRDILMQKRYIVLRVGEALPGGRMALGIK